MATWFDSLADRWLWLLAMLASVAFLVSALATLLAWRRARRGAKVAPYLDAALPGVSILKPLKGVEVGLVANLTAVASQDYPSFELLVVVADAADPAVAVVVELRRQRPDLPIRLHVGEPAPADVDLGAAARGHNPKVANLAVALAHARHELVLISDANVCPRPDYLRATVGCLLANDAALVSNLFIGSAEQRLGARFENLAFAGFVAAGVALADAVGQPCVVGKSMLLRRCDLAEAGGLAVVANVLAEDYLLGHHFARAGKRVCLADHVLLVHNADRRFRDFWSRQVRWAQMRWRIAPLAYLAEPLLAPSAFASSLLVGAWWSGNAVLAMVAGGLLIGRALLDVWLLSALRGQRPGPLTWVVSPLEDVLALGIWVMGIVRRTVSWRGHHFRLGRGSVLEPLVSPCDPRWIQAPRRAR